MFSLSDIIKVIGNNSSYTCQVPLFAGNNSTNVQYAFDKEVHRRFENHFKTELSAV